MKEKKFDFDFKNEEKLNEGAKIKRSAAPTGVLHEIHDRKETVRKERVLSVDPKRCRMWRFADRDDAGLNETECEVLIESLRPDKKQLIPALARKLEGDPDYDYELIYGNRRRWVCGYNGRHLEIKLTEANDKTCLQYMHEENAHRKDISPMERARAFYHQFNSLNDDGNPIFSSRNEMATHYSESESTIKRGVKAGELWTHGEISVIVGDMRKLSIANATTLVDLKKENERVFDDVIAGIHDNALYVNKSPSQVAKLIIAKISRVNDLGKFKKEYTVSGIGIVSVKADAKGDLTIKLPREFLEQNKTTIGDFFLKVKGDSQS